MVTDTRIVPQRMSARRRPRCAQASCHAPASAPRNGTERPHRSRTSAWTTTPARVCLWRQSLEASHKGTLCLVRRRHVSTAAGVGNTHALARTQGEHVIAHMNEFPRWFNSVATQYTMASPADRNHCNFGCDSCRKHHRRGQAGARPKKPSGGADNHFSLFIRNRASPTAACQIWP